MGAARLAAGWHTAMTGSANSCSCHILLMVYLRLLNHSFLAKSEARPPSIVKTQCVRSMGRIPRAHKLHHWMQSLTQSSCWRSLSTLSHC